MTMLAEDAIVLGEVDQAKAGADDERFWSVTTIIGQLDKPALLYWAAEQTAIEAVRLRKSLAQRVEEEGEESVVKFLRDARFHKVKGERSATELGTAVHDACEQYALTGLRPDVDDEVRPFLDQFDEWAQKWQPRYLAAEMPVFNRTFGYAGTLDFIFEVDGMRLIGDYKTSKKSIGSDGKPTHPYPEVALQLAAYRYSEIAATWRARRFEYYRRRYYLLSPEERELGVDMPSVDGGLVLHMTPEHCDAYPVQCDEAIFESFQFCIEIARWQLQTSKDVLGAPLQGA